MNVKEIIIEKLKEIGADGLCDEDCGCSIDDLFPCYTCNLSNCVPAKLIKNPDQSEADYPEIFIPLSENTSKKTYEKVDDDTKST